MAIESILPQEQAILDAIPTPCTLLDPDARIVYINSAFRSTFQSGIQPPDDDFHTGRAYAECQNAWLGRGEADVGSITAALSGERHQKVGSFGSAERPRWIRTSAYPISRGGAPFVIISKQDITEHIQQDESVMRMQILIQTVGYVAARLINDTDLEEGIQNGLARLGEALDVSRTYLFEVFSNDAGEWMLNYAYEWAATGVSAEIANPEMQNVGFQALGIDMWPPVLMRGETITCLRSQVTPALQALLDAQKILSLVCVPIFVEGKWWGFLGCDECRTERAYRESEIGTLRVAAGLFGAAMQRKNAEFLRKQSHLQEQRIKLQEETLRELSAPLIPVRDGILVMPLIGLLDEQRVQQALETLLHGISERRAKVALMDCTGVRSLDRSAADALSRAARAVELLGAKMILTGLSASLARTFIEIGIQFDKIETRGSLQDGIASALAMLGGPGFKSIV